MDSFSSVIGHEHIKNLLWKIYKDNTIPPFMIFEGPMGVGKAQMAYEFAKLLMFDNKKEVLSSPDFYLIQPLEQKADIDLSQGIRPINFDHSKDIRIDAVRELKRELSKKGTYEARLRVVLILNGENLNQEAQNSFLKTLEEPPPKTVIIMVVSHKEMILPTVYSRGKKVSFGALKFEDFKKYPFEGSVPITVLYNLSQGSIGRAKKIENSFVFAFRAKFIDILIKKDFPALYDFFEEVSVDKARTLDFLDMFSTILRDIYVMHYNDPCINSDIEGKLKTLMSHMPLDIVEDMIERTKKSYSMVLANVQRKYILLYLIAPLLPPNIRDKYDDSLRFLWE